MRLVIVIYYQTFVSPGIGATLQQAFFIRALITDDLPTLGYPINPTEIDFLFLWRTSNYFKSWIKLPLPNGFCLEAWNAMQGKDCCKYLTHF